MPYVFLKHLQDVFQDVFKTFSRRLQDVFKTSSRRACKTSCNYFFKTSSRRFQDVLEDKKMLHWRRLLDVFKTSLVRLHQDECLLGQFGVSTFWNQSEIKKYGFVLILCLYLSGSYFKKDQRYEMHQKCIGNPFKLFYHAIYMKLSHTMVYFNQNGQNIHWRCFGEKVSLNSRQNT